MKKVKMAIERINQEKSLFAVKESFFRIDIANFTNELQIMFNYNKIKEYYEINLAVLNHFIFIFLIL